MNKDILIEIRGLHSLRVRPFKGGLQHMQIDLIQGLTDKSLTVKKIVLKQQRKALGDVGGLKVVVNLHLQRSLVL